MLSPLVDIHGWYISTICSNTLNNCNHVVISILCIVAILFTYTAYNIDLESLTKEEAIFIHSVNDFWLCIARSDKISNQQ